MALSVSAALRVAFPFVGTQVGGATVSTGEMLRRLRADGRIEPVVIAPHEGPSAPVFRAAGVEPLFYQGHGGRRSVLRGSTSTWAGKLQAVPVYTALQQLAINLIRQERIDVVHLNEDRLVLPWGIAARRCRLPVVWHVRQERPNRLLDGLRLRLADRLVFVADANRTRFHNRQSLPPSVTLHNVVDPERFYPAEDVAAAKAAAGFDPERITLTFVGNLLERKRPDWVLRAAAILQARHPLEVVLIGAPLGPEQYLSSLRELATLVPEPEHVHLLGGRNDIADLLRASDLLTLPSVRQGEAFPRAVIEAMACGITVVATDVAGVRESIEPGVTGELVDPDDFDAYVLALDAVLSDAAARERMGGEGARVARDLFSGQDMAEALVALYTGLRSPETSA